MNKSTTLWVSQYDTYNLLLCNQSEKPYELWHLLDLMDEATTWDDVVLEETYTASDILMSLALGLDLNTPDYENLDLLFEAVENELNKPDKTQSGFYFS